MRIASIILISFLLLSCGKEPVQSLPKPITPVGTGEVVDLSAPSASGETQSHTGK